MTKHRFEELERRCQKLKKAKIMRIVLFLAIVSFLTFTFFYLSHQSGGKPIREPEHSTKTESLEKEEIVEVSKITPNTDEKSYDTLVLSPVIKEDSTQKQ